ncbi:hypothetical protein JCM15457_1704 [Liquorilactobacillus sucicola DSM 21376 = JCM 15457]|uniref:DAGKc domain-containing protein n=2 Tax=Liquorilactobacillus sucicola TaxID=519050 RepID=A0A023CXY9_9LACO|nr:hypothetical protein FD15_GL000897 [Liquorilactobacillus sucicola DSM 21376 = JCM 15457]GAJ26758.1 hypothetical protein JCM15457_1704 [Liquorilactobacillus sucicola DSM 21376 = JCM 15457]
MNLDNGNGGKAMCQKYIIFFNPRAGDGKAQKIADDIQKRLKIRGQDVAQLVAGGRTEAIQMLIGELPQAKAVICIGGDGSLNAVLTAFVRAKKSVPVGLIPNGTVNNFAQKWGIPLDQNKAFAKIMENNLHSVGIGKCAGQAVVSSLAFGSLASISNDVRQSEKKKYGLAVYGFNAVKNLRKNHSYKTEFYNDVFSMPAKVWFCLITTTDFVGGRRYLGTRSDGLHVTMLNNMKFSKLLNYGYFALTGNLRKSTTLTSFDVKKLIIKTTDGKLTGTRIDGDPGPDLPVKIEWLPNFVSFFM